MPFSPLSLALVALQGGVPVLAAQDPTLNLTPSASSQSGAFVAAPSGLGGTIAAGSIDSDDFNRASLGSGWQQEATGSFLISADTLISGQGNDWISRVGTTADYKDQTVEFDLGFNPNGLSYVAAVTGIGAEQLFTKVQSNAGGLYDFIGFYQGFNGGGLGTYGGFVGITPVAGGHVRMSISNAGDTMNVDIDEDLDGVYEYHYESSGILASFSGLGTGTGIGGWAADCDNWELGDGPSGPTLAITGSCPGLTTIAVTGANAFTGIALAYGAAGSFTIPGGSCPGSVLDISSPTLAGIFGADASGSLSLSVTLPAGVCGLVVQAVDTFDCSVSNTETL
ncbi:MAG: hypothetical protein ACPGQD_04825 [Planctomycetota bacterium]